MSRRKRKRYARIDAGKPPQQKIIAMEAPVAIQAAETDGDGPKVPRFDVTAYTGGAMEVMGYDLPVVLDLSGMQFSNSLKANLDHDRSKRVGHVTSKSKDGGQLVLSGLASASTNWRAEVVDSARDGYEWQASIEAMPERIIEVAEGKTAEANGQTFEGPLYMVRKSKLSGFAFVSHGADDNTTARIAASADDDTPKEIEMKDEVREWVKAMLPSVDIDALTKEEVKNLEANYEGRNGVPPTAAPKVTAESPFEARKRERNRREQVREIADKFCEMRPWDIEAIEKMYDHALEKGMSAKDFKMEMYESSIPIASAPMQPRVRDKQLNAGMLEAAVCMSAGLNKLDATFTDETLQTARDRFPNGIGLQELYLVCARANGLPERMTSQVTKEVQAYAFGNVNASRPVMGSGGVSTVSLPGILGNVANKFLLDGWGGGEMAWSEIAGRRPVRDFKQATSYRLSGNLKYLKVGADGEIKHGDVSETSYSASADTFGRMFAVTRRDIINDDLSALTQVPFELGVGAIDAFNELFWGIFLDNSTFFTAGNNNVSTDTGALGITGLKEAEELFLLQTKPNGTPLGLMPEILLVPPALKRTAMELMTSGTVVTGENTTIPNNNTFQGNFRVASSAYMQDANLTGNSASAWYLLANPTRMPVITASFLNGRESPVVETEDAEFNTLGIQMRAYHDFGANLHEYRGGVRADGSAAD